MAYVQVFVTEGSNDAISEPFDRFGALTTSWSMRPWHCVMNRSPSNKLSRSQESKDLALLELVAAEDRDALTELYARYHARLFKFVFRLTRSHTASDELVNDIMLAVWRSARNFRGDSRPSTWIFGIAQSFEQEDWVRQGIDTLPPTQRLAVELVFYLGLSYDEVAAVTDCPVNTVKTRMFHARRKLRLQLQASASVADSQGEEE